MAYSKARRLSDSISATGEVSAFVDGSITHADLHTDMDLTGKTVLVANASTGDSDTTVANTAFVQQEIAALVASAPGTLNTLNELAAALGDDASFSTTVTDSIALKAPLASPDFTGDATFDTTTLVVDATNDRVGIGTSSPSYPLEVQSGGVGTVLRAGTSFVSIDPTGSAAAPSLIFNGDVNTGFWHPASDTLAVSTAGTERLRISSSGKVGIGTDSPTTPLHVYHATTDTVANFQSGDNSVAVNFTALDNSMQIATSSTDGIIKNNGAGSFRLFNNGSERFRIASAGQLGIGGANYGTDGQILTSTGATSAPAWEDAPASGPSKGLAIVLSMIF